MTVAIGYVRVGKDQIDKDPDRRVQDAIALVFAKFDEMRSVGGAAEGDDRAGIELAAGMVGLGQGIARVITAMRGHQGEGGRAVPLDLEPEPTGELAGGGEDCRVADTNSLQAKPSWPVDE